MKRICFVAFALLIFSISSLVTSSNAEAAQTSLRKSIFTDPHVNSLLQKVHHSKRCVRWRVICRDRWGGGWRFHRCLRNHACGGHVVKRCVHWRAVCRDRWGDGWRFRRCLRIHHC